VVEGEGHEDVDADDELVADDARHRVDCLPLHLHEVVRVDVLLRPRAQRVHKSKHFQKENNDGEGVKAPDLGRADRDLR